MRPVAFWILLLAFLIMTLKSWDLEDNLASIKKERDVAREAVETMQARALHGPCAGSQ